jgi:hypothetical protein
MCPPTKLSLQERCRKTTEIPRLQGAGRKKCLANKRRLHGLCRSPTASEESRQARGSVGGAKLGVNGEQAAVDDDHQPGSPGSMLWHEVKVDVTCRAGEHGVWVAPYVRCMGQGTARLFRDVTLDVSFSPMMPPGERNSALQIWHLNWNAARLLFSGTHSHWSGTRLGGPRRSKFVSVASGLGEVGRVGRLCQKDGPMGWRDWVACCWMIRLRRIPIWRAALPWRRKKTRQARNESKIKETEVAVKDRVLGAMLRPVSRELGLGFHGHRNLLASKIGPGRCSAAFGGAWY